MDRLLLSDEEITAIRALLAELTTQYSSAEDDGFLKDACVIAHELPKRVRLFLNDFKQVESPAGTCLISGYPVNDEKIGPTPAHWKFRQGVSPTLSEEMLFVLFASLLGDVIGWATQQNGHIIHDVLPIKEDEDAQISTGSQQTIWWHNEDAFHPYRGDYVGLMCLRNDDRVPTTFVCIDAVELRYDVVKTLFEPYYCIRPDDSHSQKSKGEGALHAGVPAELLRSSYEHIQQLYARPPKVSVLFGDPKAPYIRADPYFMNPPDDDSAQAALSELARTLDAALCQAILQSGDYLFIDNYRAVHGRKPFKARYDGTDRWLKRANITRDLRKSRDMRAASTSRIII